MDFSLKKTQFFPKIPIPSHINSILIYIYIYASLTRDSPFSLRDSHRIVFPAKREKYCVVKARQQGPSPPSAASTLWSGSNDVFQWRSSKTIKRHAHRVDGDYFAVRFDVFDVNRPVNGCRVFFGESLKQSSFDKFHIPASILAERTSIIV